MLKWLRITGIAFVDLVVAVFGTTVIDSAIHGRAYDRATMLLIEDARSAAIAFILGFFVYCVWKTPSSRWVWIVGAIWFGQRALTYWNSQRDFNAILHSGHSLFWEMSGAGAAANFDVQSMGDWAGYTLPLLRTVFYSLGAHLCSELFRRGWEGWPVLSGIRIRSPFGKRESTSENLIDRHFSRTGDELADDNGGGMGWRVLGDDKKVAIVVEPDFQGDLVTMAGKHPVWIVETPENRRGIEAAWKVGKSMDLCYVNKYVAQDANDREDSLTGILDSIDLHHGKYAQGGGYDGLIVHGLAAAAPLELRLAALGFKVSEVTEDGFVALGTLVETTC